MVQSALEFIHICESHNYRDLVVSMKSSNPQVMIQAYRLLAARMTELGMTYPFHLGVTEAGDGEDGRIKSAVGIGALLEDGIGDTIRVSLTEDSIYEVPVAQALVKKFNDLLKLSLAKEKLEVRSQKSPTSSIEDRASRIQRPAASNQNLLSDLETAWMQQVNPYEYRRRPSVRVNVPGFAYGKNETVRVGVAVNGESPLSAETLAALTGQKKNGLHILGKPATDAVSAERLEIGHHPSIARMMRSALLDAGQWLPMAMPHGKNESQPEIILFQIGSTDKEQLPAKLKQLFTQSQRTGCAIEFLFTPDQDMLEEVFDDADMTIQAALATDSWNWSIGIVLQPETIGAVGAARALIAYFDHRGAILPVTLRYSVPPGKVDWHTDAAGLLGALLCDGVGDAVVVGGTITTAAALRFSYNLLQATRLRISKTEFISCPSCGRTLFNLQTTTERIKARTGHLKGVKIAIMGCIVNGPGEMADADFGYVGSGPQKVNLFVGKECVERNVPETDADSRLVELIKKHNKWVEPEVVE
jgi:(E)-4-hydroxy-3-methylbut-2-enyl-diphosphate synthase